MDHCPEPARRLQSELPLAPRDDAPEDGTVEQFVLAAALLSGVVFVLTSMVLVVTLS